MHDRNAFCGLGQDPYAPRVNRALDYIDSHLSDALSLELIAQHAPFSAGHFHRVFKSWMGETLYDYIQRRRLESSAAQLRYNHWDSVTMIARTSGFSSPETFSRAFKRRFGMTPREWRNLDWVAEETRVVGNTDGLFSGKQVNVRRVCANEIAYWRLHGRYEDTCNPAWQRFLTWLPSVGLQDSPLIAIGLDDPAITAPDLCRYDTCAVLTESTSVRHPHASRRVLRAALYACVTYTGKRADIRAAWHWLKAHWLPTSGFSIADGPYLECYAPGVNPLPDNWLIEAELCMPIML